MEAAFDVVALGNAIVDIIAGVDDAFLVTHGLTKGAMALTAPEVADALYAAMPPGLATSGGSAANTTVGVAALGNRAAFVGKVRDDQLGEVFAHDIRAAGVHFDNRPATVGPPTGRSLIVVTPDAQRTMSTSLGIAGDVTVDDIDAELVAAARITYCEGYLWDSEPTKAAIRHAMDLAGAAGRTVALTLSDGFCVERHRAEFLGLAESRVDVLFANEPEICSLYETDSFAVALDRVQGQVKVAFLTRGPAGAMAVAGGAVHSVEAMTFGAVVDTTGAGDQFAAGALAGLARALDLETCARLGSLAAGEVIGHVGPRPAQDLKALAARHLGLAL